MTPQKIVPWLIAVLVLSLTAHDARAEGETITEIDVVENSKTTDDTVILIADVDIGDHWSDELGKRIEKNLISSGLFSSVKTFTGPTQKGVGVRLTIIAKEKHSWVVGPTFYNEPGNRGGGLGFLEANLFGENKKLLAYAQYATADSLFVAAYWDPSIAGTAFSWRIYAFGRRENIIEYTDPDPSQFAGQPEPDRKSVLEQLSGGLLVGVNLWRGLTLDAEITPGYFKFKAARDAMTGAVVERPQDNGWDVPIRFRLIRDKRANWHGVQQGSKFTLAYERAFPSLGSDVKYWQATANLILAKKIFAEHNFVIKLGGGVGKKLPFQREFTAGGNGLRGYINDQFRGDAQLTSTLEYSVPLFKIQPFAFRAMVFWDSAFTSFYMLDDPAENPQRHYIGPEQTDVNFNQWRNGVGAGMRVYIKSVVLPLLGVDIGYGIEAQDYHIYFALGLLEF